MTDIDVVLIDDDDNVRWILQEILSMENISHRAAGTGPEGLDLIKEHKPHLAILDVKLGTMSGLDVAKKIPDICSYTKILFITGYSEVIKEKVDNYQYVAGVIEKPFNISEFLKTVKDILREGQALNIGV